jgi:hypothetical protein
MNSRREKEARKQAERAIGQSEKYWRMMTSTLDKFVLQELVLKPEVSLLALAPCSLIVKIDVSALLIVISNRLRFLVTLEPCQVLLMEPP